MAKRPPIFIDDEHGSFTRTQFRKLNKQDKLELMEAWFRHRYEDPVHRTPHESSEGGYLYIYGGPYSARDELSEFEGLAPEAWIEEVVDTLEQEATDWTSAPDEGDYDAAPDQEGLLQIGSEEELDLRSHLQARIEELERQLAGRPPIYGMKGHNNPPEAISDEEISDLDDLEETISELKSELGKSVPVVDNVVPQFEKATNLRDRLKAAALKKLDLATDEFAKSAGNELGKSLGKLAFWGPVLSALTGALSWLESWLRAIGAL